jgi:hypothetical protein
MARPGLCKRSLSLSNFPFEKSKQNRTEQNRAIESDLTPTAKTDGLRKVWWSAVVLFKLHAFVSLLARTESLALAMGILIEWIHFFFFFSFSLASAICLLVVARHVGQSCVCVFAKFTGSEVQSVNSSSKYRPQAHSTSFPERTSIAVRDCSRVHCDLFLSAWPDRDSSQCSLAGHGQGDLLRDNERDDSVWRELDERWEEPSHQHGGSLGGN